MRLALFVFFLCLGAWAQHSAQPEKESSSDLRSNIIMFSIEDTEEDSIYWLERTANEDYFLRMKDEDKDEKLLKVSSRDARSLERDFATRFLKVQYVIPTAEGSCKVTLRLTLKGDGQDVCQKDDKKTQELKPFLAALTKRF